MFSIEVTYRTGDSFGSEVTTTTFGAWNTPRDAEVVLDIIKQHYHCYKDVITAPTSDTAKSALRNYRKQKFYTNRDRNDFNQNSESEVVRVCAAPDVNGVWKQIPVDIWCGYFETLYSARVVFEGKEVTL